MSQLIDNFNTEEEYSGINKRLFFVEILYKPLKSFKYIINNIGDKYVNLIFLIVGISTFNNVYLLPIFGLQTFDITRAAVFFMGSALGSIAFLYLLTGIYTLIAKWVVGTYNFNGVKIALGWSRIPTILYSLVQLSYDIFIVFSLKNDVYYEEHILVNTLLTILKIGTLVWSAIIFSMALMYVFRIGFLKALIIIFIPYLIYIAFLFGGNFI
jgi:hypothetical protein